MTDTTKQGSNIVSTIVKSITEKLRTEQIEKKQILGIGIGAPGFIDVKNGAIYKAVNIGWEYYPLKEEIEEALRLPTFVDNDANVAAVGEMWQGAAVGAENILCVTLGTGVGCGIISDGKIVHGHRGYAGEIGHFTTVVNGGARCNCGKFGCLETVASATGIVRLAYEKIQDGATGALKMIMNETGKITAKDVLDAAKEKDRFAMDVVYEAMNHLGFALGNLANVLNPELIIIGGGVSKAGDFLLQIVRNSATPFMIPSVKETTKIALATLGNDAGVIGATWLVKENVLMKKEKI